MEKTSNRLDGTSPVADSPLTGTPPPALWRRVVPFLALLAVAVVVFLLRAVYLERSFDIFIDEITYLRISQDVGEHLTVTLYGEPFFLHPPAFFYLQAAYLRLFPVTGHTIDQIQSVRYLNVGLAALSGVLLYRIGAHLKGWHWGLVVAGLFALDPFIIRMNSRNLLDTAAIFWMVLGLWLLLAKSTTRLPFRTTTDLSRRRIGLVGICFGLAVLTKDMMAFLTLMPLGLLWLSGWVFRRRATFAMGAITLLVYAVYPLTVWVRGEGDAFLQQKFRGVLRLAGLVQETGVNRSGGPTLLDTIIARLGEFGITYGLIALGAGAVLLLWSRPGAADRLVALWSGSAYALLGYCILFGTLEEQFFYFLVVPCVLAIPLALEVLLEWSATQRIRLPVRGVVLLLGLIFVGWGSYQWSLRHLTPDNGYEQLIRYLDAEVPAGSRVASMSETGQFILDEYESGPWGSWHRLEDLQKYEPDYLLISTNQVAWDYGAAATPLLDWVEREGEIVWQFEGQSTGQLSLYRLPELFP